MCSVVSGQGFILSPKITSNKIKGSFAFKIADRRVLQVRHIWWCVRRWNLTQGFQWVITWKNNDLDAGCSSLDFAHARYMRNMFIQLPCGNSFSGKRAGLWFMEVWKVAPMRRESTSLSKSSCRRASSAPLRTCLDANLRGWKARC